MDCCISGILHLACLLACLMEHKLKEFQLSDSALHHITPRFGMINRCKRLCLNVDQLTMLVGPTLTVLRHSFEARFECFEEVA
jgi:hypothetical protein